ncbi:WXG100 family type VII secretion target [Microbacterium sp. JZ37]|nr:WXG100 family type VII secretion target [Microbacterium sp. JZ37]
MLAERRHLRLRAVPDDASSARKRRRSDHTHVDAEVRLVRDSSVRREHQGQRRAPDRRCRLAAEEVARMQAMRVRPGESEPLLPLPFVRVLDLERSQVDRADAAKRAPEIGRAQALLPDAQRACVAHGEGVAEILREVHPVPAHLLTVAPARRGASALSTATATSGSRSTNVPVVARGPHRRFGAANCDLGGGGALPGGGTRQVPAGPGGSGAGAGASTAALCRRRRRASGRRPRRRRRRHPLPPARRLRLGTPPHRRISGPRLAWRRPRSSGVRGHDFTAQRGHTTEEEMAEIKVTSESLASVAGQLSSGSQSIESQLSNLKSLVEGLIAGDWNGQASQSFNELYSQWDQAGIQLKESLQGISDLLNQAALSYEDSESAIAATFNG